eukprot:scaffold1036_cov169-Ochromonas_danica.AAC.24
MSSKHAEIIIKEGQATVRDLRSSNGTFVEIAPVGSGNYKKLTISENSRLLGDGGKLRLGMVCCTLRLVSTSQARTSSTQTTEATQPQQPPQQQLQPQQSLAERERAWGGGMQVETQLLPGMEEHSLTPTGSEANNSSEKDKLLQLQRDDLTEGYSTADEQSHSAQKQKARIHEYQLDSIPRLLIPLKAAGGSPALHHEFPTQVDREDEAALVARGGKAKRNGEEEEIEGEDDRLSPDLMVKESPPVSFASISANSMETNSASVSLLDRLNAIRTPAPSDPGKPPLAPPPPVPLARERGSIAQSEDEGEGGEGLVGPRRLPDLTPQGELLTPAPAPLLGLAPPPSASVVEEVVTKRVSNKRAKEEENKVEECEPPVKKTARGKAAVKKSVSSLETDDSELKDSDEEEKGSRRTKGRGGGRIAKGSTKGGRLSTKKEIEAREKEVEDDGEAERAALQDSDEEVLPSRRPRTRSKATDPFEQLIASATAANTVKNATALHSPEEVLAAAAPATSTTAMPSSNKKRSPVRFQEEEGGGGVPGGATNGIAGEEQSSSAEDLLVDTPLVNSSSSILPAEASLDSKTSTTLIPAQAKLVMSTPGNDEEGAGTGVGVEVVKKGSRKGKQSVQQGKESAAVQPVVAVAVEAAKGRGRKRALPVATESDTTVEPQNSSSSSSSSSPSLSQALPVEAVAAPPAKRGKGAAASRESSSKEVVPPSRAAAGKSITTGIAYLLFTKIEEAPYIKPLKKLGGHVSITSDPVQATHCITTSELKRTPKLMMALNYGVRYVLTEEWIQECLAEGKVLDVIADEAKLDSEIDDIVRKESDEITVDSTVFDDVRGRYEEALASSKYLVRDLEKEALWHYNLPQTITRIRISHTINAVRGRKEGVFTGYGVFFTRGVCGKTAPAAEEMQVIVESGGGIWIEDILDYAELLLPGKTITKGKGAGKKKGKTTTTTTTKAEDAIQSKPFRSIIIVSHSSVAKEELSNDVVNLAIASGALGVYSLEVIFQAVLRQKLDLHDHFLDLYRFT